MDWGDATASRQSSLLETKSEAEAVTAATVAAEVVAKIETKQSLGDMMHSNMAGSSLELTPPGVVLGTRWPPQTFHAASHTHSSLHGRTAHAPSDKLLPLEPHEP